MADLYKRKHKARNERGGLTPQYSRNGRTRNCILINKQVKISDKNRRFGGSYDNGGSKSFGDKAIESHFKIENIFENICEIKNDNSVSVSDVENFQSSS